MIIGAVGLALLGIGSAQAQTASVIPLQGDLSVNQGQGFQRVDSRIGANVGDSLMVSPGGSATVVYQDGCQVSVQPGSVTTIAPLSPCASGSQAQVPQYHEYNYDYALVALGVGGAVLGAAALGVAIDELTHKTKVYAIFPPTVEVTLPCGTITNPCYVAISK